MIGVLPYGVRAHHRVEDREELAHASGERDFLGLAGGEEAAIESLEHGVAAGTDEGGHVQGGADGRPPTPDQALVRQCPAVAGEGRDADQGRDLFAREDAEFREFADKGATENGAHAGRRAQEVVLGAPED